MRTPARSASTSSSRASSRPTSATCSASGEVDTPDRTVTPRRVLAKQSPKNLVANFQNIFGANLVNEFKVGWNAPKTSALAFGPAGYDPIGVSLSGNFTSSSHRRSRQHRASRAAAC